MNETFLAWVRVLEQAQREGWWSGLGACASRSTAPDRVWDERMLEDMSWFTYTFTRRIS